MWLWVAKGIDFSWSRLFGLIVCLSLCLLSAPNSLHAEKTSMGVLADVFALPEDTTKICSVFDKKGKISSTISLISGKKFLKKSFWTLNDVKLSVFQLNTIIKKLKSKRDPASIKKLKKAKLDKIAMGITKKQIANCKLQFAEPSKAEKVTFAHVEKTIKSKCMNCHETLGWKNTNAFFVDSGRVVPGNLEASPFYSFLSKNPEKYLPAYMPKGTAPLSDQYILLFRKWVLDASNGTTPIRPTATPGGIEGEGRTLYNKYCASCHGMIDVSAKWGKSEADILKALGPNGIPQMRHLSLTSEEISKIALALSKVQPPLEGTLEIRSLGGAQEGNSNSIGKNLRFEIEFKGTASQHFTVGYVTSNGSALAGSDYVFSAGTLEFAGQNGEKHEILIPIISDDFQESDETLYVDIGGVSYGGTRVSLSTASGTIINDDMLNAATAPSSNSVRLAYSYNGDYRDALQLSNAIPQGDTQITTLSKIGSGALELDQGSDYLTVPGTNLQTLNDFTFSSWVFWTNNATSSSRIFDFGASTSSYIYFSPRDSLNRCRFELRTPAGVVFSLQCPLNTNLPNNQWVYLATTFNSSTDEMKIFFNGQEIAVKTGVNAVMSTMVFSDNRLGKSRVATDPDFAGRLDETIVWGSALSQSEIVQSMNMTSSANFRLGMEVKYNNQIVANGSTFNIGSVEVGKQNNFTLLISTSGLAPLEFVSSPNVILSGVNPSEFGAIIQPWPWQQMIRGGTLTAVSVRFSPSSPGVKSATLIIPNTDSLQGNFALGIVAQATGNSLPPAPSPLPNDSGLAQGRYLYSTNCASCHGVLSQSQKRGATATSISNALNPVTGIVQMRGLALNAQQIELISLALNSPPPQSEFPKVDNSTITVGTAAYVASVFTDIFLPDAAIPFTAGDTTINNTIRLNILGRNPNNSQISGRYVLFGGLCERFDTGCHSESLQSTQQPAVSVSRTGMIVKTCDDILSIDRSVENVLSKIQKTTSSTIEANSVQAIYKLFFPGRDMPQYLSEASSTFSNGMPQFTQLEKWRFLINLTCTSSSWEAF